MKRIQFLLLVFFCCTIVSAQTKTGVFLTDAEGRPITVKNVFNIEGSYTFPSQNCNASVKIKNGKEYQNIQGRINLITNEFIYTVDNKELACILPIEAIVFADCDETKSGIFRSGYPDIDQKNQQTFYEVLNEGKASLLKNYIVEWRDEKPYSSALTTRVFTIRPTYYLFLKGKMFKLDKNRKNLVSILDFYAISDYIERENINLKDDADAIKLIKHYNSL